MSTSEAARRCCFVLNLLLAGTNLEPHSISSLRHMTQPCRISSMGRYLTLTNTHSAHLLSHPVALHTPSPSVLSSYTAFHMACGPMTTEALHSFVDVLASRDFASSDFIGPLPTTPQFLCSGIWIAGGLSSVFGGPIMVCCVFPLITPCHDPHQTLHV